MDFSVILFLLVLITGCIVLIDRYFCNKQLMYAKKTHKLQKYGSYKIKKPVIIEYAQSLFPVFLIVFVLRAFVVEPFRIPSGSMLPNLHIGDFILVNKFVYGIRFPIMNQKIVKLNKPERGDVIVFKYPRNPKLNFIKRVIGIPGDGIKYENKQLFINGEMVNTQRNGEYTFEQPRLRGRIAKQLTETINQSTHQILIDPKHRPIDMTVQVPDGHYFVMGDNRDHSNDSRYWRFVPENHVFGQAFFIWFSWKGIYGGWVDWNRIGTVIK